MSPRNDVDTEPREKNLFDGVLPENEHVTALAIIGLATTYAEAAVEAVRHLELSHEHTPDIMDSMHKAKGDIETARESLVIAFAKKFQL